MWGLADVIHKGFHCCILDDALGVFFDERDLDIPFAEVPSVLPEQLDELFVGPEEGADGELIGLVQKVKRAFTDEMAVLMEQSFTGVQQAGESFKAEDKRCVEFNVGSFGTEDAGAAVNDIDVEHTAAVCVRKGFNKQLSAV